MKKCEETCFLHLNHYVAQDGLELSNLTPQLLEYWDADLYKPYKGGVWVEKMASQQGTHIKDGGNSHHPQHHI